MYKYVTRSSDCVGLKMLMHAASSWPRNSLPLLLIKYINLHTVVFLNTKNIRMIWNGYYSVPSEKIILFSLITYYLATV